MAYYFHSVLILIVAALLNTGRAAVGKDSKDFAARVTKTLNECAAAHKTTQKDMLDAVMKPENFPEGAFSCAWACVFKKTDLIDSNGKYVAEAAIKHLREYSSGPKVEEGIQSAQRCNSVNAQPVSDGAAGCDRAKHLVKCLVKDLLKI